MTATIYVAKHRRTWGLTVLDWTEELNEFEEALFDSDLEDVLTDEGQCLSIYPAGLYSIAVEIDYEREYGEFGSDPVGDRPILRPRYVAKLWPLPVLPSYP